MSDELDHMDDDELHRIAVRNFIDMFADELFCINIAPRFTCDEADIISAMPDGSYPIADEEDLHHIPEIPDDISGAEL